MNQPTKHGCLFDLKPYSEDFDVGDIVVVDGPCTISLVRTENRKLRVCIDADKTVRFKKVCNVPACSAVDKSA